MNFFKRILQPQTSLQKPFYFQSRVTLGHSGEPSRVAIDPIQRIVAVAFNSGKILLFNHDTQVYLNAEKNVTSQSILYCKFIPGTPFVWVLFAPFTWIVFDIQQGHQVTEFNDASPLQCIEIPLGAGSVWMGYGFTVHLRNAQGSLLQEFNFSDSFPNEKSLVSIQCCPTDMTLLLLASPKKILLYNWTEKKEIKSFQWEFSTCLDTIAWKPDGSHFVSSHHDMLVFWSIKESSWLSSKSKPICTRSLLGHQKSDDSLSLSYLPITKIEWFPLKDDETLLLVQGGQKQGNPAGLTLLHLKSNYKSAHKTVFLDISVHDWTARLIDNRLILAVIDTSHQVFLKSFQETWSDIPLCPNFDFSNQAKDANISCIVNVNDLMRMEMFEALEQAHASKILSETKKLRSLSHTKDYDLSIIASKKGQVYFWDITTQTSLLTLDFTKYFSKTHLLHIYADLNQKILILYGGPHVILLKYHSSSELKLIKSQDEDMQRLFNSLDETVASAIRDAQVVVQLMENKSPDKTSIHETDPEKSTEAPIQQQDLNIPTSPVSPLSATSISTTNDWIIEFLLEDELKVGWNTYYHFVHHQIIDLVTVNIHLELYPFQ